MISHTNLKPRPMTAILFHMMSSNPQLGKLSLSVFGCQHSTSLMNDRENPFNQFQFEFCMPCEKIMVQSHQQRHSAIRPQFLNLGMLTILGCIVLSMSMFVQVHQYEQIWPEPMTQNSSLASTEVSSNQRDRAASLAPIIVEPARTEGMINKPVVVSTAAPRTNTIEATTVKSTLRGNNGYSEQKAPALSMSTTRIIDKDFELAFHESLGFFDDLHSDQWLRLKEITKQRIHHATGYRDTPLETTYYQMNWDPDFSCLYEQSIGQVIADGHKWVCDPHRLVQQHKDCLVYSFGSEGNFHFEADLLRVAPNCEIHVFDPTNYTEKMEAWGLNATNYHVWGLKGSYSSGKTTIRTEYSDQMDKTLSALTFRSLLETMQILGHVGRRIDVFKIDCEGCEWSVYKDFLKADLRQILIEVHAVTLLTPDFFQDLHSEGYVIFHKEPNIQYAGGKCTEFSFLKLAKEFFQ